MGVSKAGLGRNQQADPLLLCGLCGGFHAPCMAATTLFLIPYTYLFFPAFSTISFALSERIILMKAVNTTRVYCNKHPSAHAALPVWGSKQPQW